MLHGHSQDVKSVCWNPNSDMLVSASYDDTLKVWLDDGDDWYCAETLTGHKSTVWDVAFNNTGNTLVSVSDDLSIKVWKYFERGVAGTAGNVPRGFPYLEVHI